jgi:carboxyl-terminal processing protease
VPLDTSFSSRFLTEVVSNALIGKFAYDYLDRNRVSITGIKELEAYAKAYQLSNNAYQEFVRFAVTQGCASPSISDSKKSESFIKLQIKALMARQIWRDKGYYMVIQQNDKGLKAAIEALSKSE